MTVQQFQYLLSLGLTPQEIMCALEPGPWAKQYETKQYERRAPCDI